MGYPTDLDDRQYEVGVWATKTFPHATIETTAAHLSDEVKELQEFSHDGVTLVPGEKEKAAMECADIALMLLHIAHRYGFSLQDAIRAKFEINKARQWGEPDERGVVRHIAD